MKSTLLLTLPLLLVACDEQVTLNNTPPTVTAEALCSQGGRTFLAVRTRDVERDRVDLEIEATLDARTGRLPAGPVGDGLIGLPTDATTPGRLHLIEWAAPCDAPDCADACLGLSAPFDRSSSSVCLTLTTPPRSVDLVLRARDADVGPAVSVTLSLSGPCPR